MWFGYLMPLPPRRDALTRVLPMTVTKEMVPGPFELTGNSPQQSEGELLRQGRTTG